MLFRGEILWRILLAILIIAALIVTVIIIVRWQNSGGYQPDLDIDVVLESDGKKYRYRSDVELVLIMGVDKYGDEVQSDSYNNDQKADFLMLLVVDKTNRIYHSVQINRDTMAELDVIGVGGQKVGTVTAQLALAHTYGSGGQDSCRNTAVAVSRLFGGIRIDKYIAMTMDTVGFVNDLVGGVTLTVADDMSMLDTALVKGETVTLTGQQALLYVRSRSGLLNDTNAARMQRQKQYLDALFEKFGKYDETEHEITDEQISELFGYVTTDCNLNELESLKKMFEEYESGDITELEGETRVVANVEFYPTDKSINEILIKYILEEKT